MAVIPLTIGGISEAKAQLADLKKSIDEAGNSKNKGALSKEFKTLEKQVDSTTKAFDTMNKSGENLNATFEDIYGEGAKPLTNQIGELEDRLYAMALAGEQSTDEFKQISEQVGKLKGTIIDVDKSIDLLSENRGLSVFSTGLGQVGERLVRLDFEGAGRDAKALNDNIGNLGKIGKSAITGLSKTVGQLSKAFIKMGVALLANPIFLIVVVISAIVLAIVALMSKLGFLQPILDGISTAFGYIKDAIMLVVQAIKDFLDWIGLTTFAQEELARKNSEMIDTLVANIDKKQKALTTSYDHEIRLAKIAGEDTVKEELRKQGIIIQTEVMRSKLLKERIRLNEITNDLSDEELAKLEEQLALSKELIQTSSNEIEAISAQASADKQARQKSDYDKWKSIEEKKLADEKTFGAERVRVQRQIEDAKNRLLEDSLLKELILNSTKYDRLIEDTLNNEKLLKEEKDALIEIFETEQLEKEEALRDKDEEAKELKIQAEVDFITQLNEAIEAEQDEADTISLAKSLKKDADELEQAKSLKDAKLFMADSLMQGLQGIEALIASTGAKTVGLQKALAVAQIAIDTAKAISAVVAGASAASLAGGPAAPFLLVGYIASGIASVAAGIAGAYKALKSAPPVAGSGGGGGGGAIPSAPSTTTQPATPSFELFGQNNEGNNLTAPEDVESGGEIVVKAYVSETEITSTQNKINQITLNSSL